MEKRLYYTLSDRDGEGGTMELSGCMEWIRGDMASNYIGSENCLPEDLPEYTLTPVWMTDEEYEALPEQ